MDITALLAENLAQGFVIGVILGLVINMASKAVRNLLIFQFIVLKWLEARNIIIVDWHRMSGGFIGKQEVVVNQSVDLIESLVEMGVFGAALAAGFLLARRIGK